MPKLWEKGYQLDQLVEDFTVGEDPLLDQQLIFYDCIGSMAHAAMLEKINILTKEEFQQLHKGLQSVIQLEQKNEFSIKSEEEDVHTAIENFLTQNIGEVGKKLHTARSRNDQVLLDLRLYTKKELLELCKIVLQLAKTLQIFAEKYKNIPIPGRTHLQKAMPSSLGLWAGAFMESLLEDFLILQNAYQINNQCPLGSAASYGASIAIDRQFTADLLGFQKVQNNVLYANNSRGKFESIHVHAFAQTMNDLSKLSSDLILFSIPEFAYLRLPKKYCSGSSLMPQKHNPCAMELIRAKAATVSSSLLQLLEIIRAIPSGYNRDFQETKAPFMKALATTKASTLVMERVFQDIEVNKKACLEAFSPELFATDKVLQLVEKGIAFRDAYKQVANDLQTVKSLDPVENILMKKHIGATGNLQLHLATEQMETYAKWLQKEQDSWEETVNKIINLI